MAMLCLDKICEQKEFFKDLMADTKSFSKACKKPYLKMECKDDKKCVCSPKKRSIDNGHREYKRQFCDSQLVKYQVAKNQLLNQT